MTLIDTNVYIIIAAARDVTIDKGITFLEFFVSSANLAIASNPVNVNIVIVHPMGPAAGALIKNMNMMTAVVKNVSIVDLVHTALVPEAHTKIIVMDIQGSVDIVVLLLLELALEVLIKDTKSN